MIGLVTFADQAIRKKVLTPRKRPNPLIAFESQAYGVKGGWNTSLRRWHAFASRLGLNCHGSGWQPHAATLYTEQIERSDEKHIGTSCDSNLNSQAPTT